MTEIELKFLLDERMERRLRTHPGLRRMTRGRATTEQLRTIYFDTADWRLRQRRIALRLRRTGDRWIQTVKAGRAIRGGLSRAREVEIERDEGRIDLDAIRDEALRDEIIAALDGHAFEPVIETEIRRQTRMLEHAGSLIEFALDCGDVIAGDRRALLREAELELIEGEPAALFDAAAGIFDRGLVRFSDRSKSERGYLLATEDRIAAPVAVRKARRVDLEAKVTTEEAAQALLAECLDQVTENAAVVLAGDDSEGPHQLRVGLRRLRTVFRFLPKDHAPPRVEVLAEEARRLGAVTGSVRDLDVMRGEILAPAAALPADGVAALDQALADRAGVARSELRQVLQEARTQRFLLDVAAAAAAGVRRRRAGDLGAEHLERPIGETAEDALRRNWKRVKARAKGIAGLSIEDRHELRKALKTLRYTIEFAAPLYGRKAVKPFLKSMKALQDVFGELNDLAMAERLLLASDPPAAADPRAQLTAGLLVGAARVRAEHSWEGAKTAWKALKKQERFWE